MSHTPIPFKNHFFFKRMIYTIYFIYIYKLYIYKINCIIELYQAAVTVEISILLICFCSFDLFCPLLDKDNSIENSRVLLNRVLFKPCLFRFTLEC